MCIRSFLCLKTATYIAELPLSVSQETDRQLSARLLVGTRLYNAALGESLRRLDLMRESKAWQSARKLKAKDRSSAFQALTKAFGFYLCIGFFVRLELQK